MKGTKNVTKTVSPTGQASILVNPRERQTTEKAEKECEEIISAHTTYTAL